MLINKFDSLIFDLDGTLWDASHNSALAWTQAAEALDIPLSFNSSDIKAISGLPFKDCVEQKFAHLNLQESQIINVLDKFEREHITANGGTLYSGVKETLIKLSQYTKIFLVSNCQDWYLKTFFKHFDLISYFQDTTCFGQTELPKKENIKSIIKKHNLKRSIYIGDTHWDQEAAYFAGSKFIFAKYGFGQPRVSCPFINNFSELSNLLFSPFEEPIINYRKLSFNEFEIASGFYKSVGYSPEPQPKDLYYAAFHKGEVVGIVRLAFEYENWVLRGMQVKPNYQYFGIGTELIYLLENDLSEKECFCMPHGWLEKFYSQIGFKKTIYNNEVPNFLLDRLKENKIKYPHLILMKRGTQ